MRTATRVVIGLGLGFVATYATVEAIDRLAYDSPGGEPVEQVLGDPDFESFCTDEFGRVAVNSTGDPYGWRCAGTTNGLWSADEFEVEDVCLSQFGDGATAYLQDETAGGWLCVAGP